MCNARIVLCEACGSEGRIYRGQYEDERDCGPMNDVVAVIVIFIAVVVIAYWEVERY